MYTPLPYQDPAAFRQARHHLGLTGAQLAAALHVDTRTVRKWEAGDRRIPGTVALLVSMWLDPAYPPHFLPSRSRHACR